MHRPICYNRLGWAVAVIAEAWHPETATKKVFLIGAWCAHTHLPAGTHETDDAASDDDGDKIHDFLWGGHHL
eukprot:12924331-Prorocentrum_lima.AAC.1